MVIYWRSVLLVIMIGPCVLANHRSDKPSLCKYPCQCRVRELDCAEGVAMIKDGCGCCYMCARQHGDLCNVKDKCDSKQGLFCDLSRPRGPGTGICRAKEAKPCKVNNVVYQDGETFYPECSRQCTCQNGNYGCADLCPDDYRIPTSKDCKTPKMMPVSGKCCKQWMCDTAEQRPDSAAGKSPRHLMTSYRHMALKAKPSREEKSLPQTYLNKPRGCTPSSTEWTHCSKDCDTGVSEQWVEDSNCQKTKKMRLCILRHCNTTVFGKDMDRCTPTARTLYKETLWYQDCKSVRPLNFKFCTNCKKNRCCWPKKVKTRHVQFQCNGGSNTMYSLMWIKSCRCDRQCYKKDSPPALPWQKG